MSTITRAAITGRSTEEGFVLEMPPLEEELKVVVIIAIAKP